jgi:hypothetical protein
MTDRYWIEDRGGVAEIADEARSAVGMAATLLVPLADVQRLPGIDYDQIRPRWFVKRSPAGYELQDQPVALENSIRRLACGFTRRGIR